MIVDTSAILAILLQEVDARQFAEAIHSQTDIEIVPLGLIKA